MSTFSTISVPSEALLVEKASKFIAFSFEVYNETDIKKALEGLREIHPKSNHHCYAYRLGLDAYNYRANDDGEPSGSAGRPILGQIDSAGLTNTLVVVVRYFGGTKLGVSGLISAYKKATHLVLEKSNVKEVECSSNVTIECDYLEVNDLLNVLKKMELQTASQDYSEQCKIMLSVPDSKMESLALWLEDRRIDFTKTNQF